MQCDQPNHRSPTNRKSTNKKFEYQRYFKFRFDTTYDLKHQTQSTPKNILHYMRTLIPFEIILHAC